MRDKACGRCSTTRSEPTPKSRHRTQVDDDPSKVRYDGKTCHLCDDGDDCPCYDLWHVLFECRATSESAEIVALRASSADFLLQICAAVLDAVERNSQSMSNTMHAGVSHDATREAVQLVRDAVPGYDWSCMPGRWLTYTLLLALPFPAKVVRPDAAQPVWFAGPKRRVRGVVPAHDLTGMPAVLPALSDHLYRLPELVGRMYDSVILTGDALRSLEDAWCVYARRNLLRAGAVVRPLRVAAETARAAARAAGDLDDDGDRSTTSFVASTDGGSGSTADSVSEL